MIAFVKKLYHKQQFNPGFWGLFINPFFFARRGLYKNISSLSKFIQGKTLDVGCGSKPYKEIYSSSEYVGLEIDTPENRAIKNADYFYDGKTFPFAEKEFDSIVANQVFEHVFNPDQFLTEINRVLKTEGTFLMTVPFVWDEHEQPHDYARYSSFAIKHLFESHGFKIEKHIKSVNDLRVIFQLINGYIYKKLYSRFQSLNLLVYIFLTAPFNIAGSLISFILPSNNDLYLDNIVLAKKVK